jgi:hypothetical protein
MSFIMRPIRFASTGHIIEGSGLFDGSTGTLARTPGSAGNVDTYTLEFIFKLNDAGSIAVNNYLFAAGTAGANRTIFYVNTANKLGMLHTSGGATTLGRETTALLRDPSSYYQVIYVVDTSESTAADRCKMYLNGTLIEDFSYEVSTIAQNANTFVNSTDPQRISRGAASAANYADVYMARTTLIDGQALDPTSFGETTDDGFWSILDVSGLDFTGTNSFLIEGGSAMSAGTDSSGNSNDFTKSGTITATNDSPTNDSANGYGNYATWDALNNNLISTSRDHALSNGNRTTTLSGSTSSRSALTIHPSHNVHVEFIAGAVSGLYPFIQGFVTGGERGGSSIFQNSADGENTVGLVDGASAAEWSAGQRVTIEVDTINGRVYFWVNGTAQNSANPDAGSGYTLEYTPTGDGHISICTVCNGSATMTVNADNPADTVNTGYVTLSTANLPTPAIINPDDHFFSTIIDHDGSDTDGTCTFNLDTYEWLAIIKNTTGAVEKWYWIDSLNGVNKYWSTVNSDAQTTDANVMSVSGTTFTLGSTLGDKDYLVEFHKAGLAADTAANTAGAQNTTETSFNTESGFVIHLYEGTGANTTLGNPLAKALDFMIAKRLDGTDNALSWHKDLDTPTTGYLDLATTAPEANHASIWNSTIPTATLISLGSNSNVNTAATQVLYGWHSVDSYSLFWRHEGTANADGPFINTGSYPNVILTKDIDTAADSWYYFNQALSSPNQWGYPLLLQDTHVPVDNSALDAVSNGIKLRSTNSPNVASSYVGVMWGGRPMTDGSINQGRADGNPGVARTIANGGSLSFDGDYAINTFNASGTISFDASPADGVEYLVIAGGGGGGANIGSGGGAGGYRTATGFAVTANTSYAITVGAGGAGGTSSIGAKGANSVFSSITSTGGGYGNNNNDATAPSTGGSGGGGARDASGAASAPVTDPVQGFAGGDGVRTNGYDNAPGGGGGASEVGQDGATNANSGDGGDGRASSISGSSVTRGGGGAGGGYQNSVPDQVLGSGGAGGGGQGSLGGTASPNADQDGDANTGGGGGGGGWNNELAVSNSYGGDGGSGVVIIRYKYK